MTNGAVANTKLSLDDLKACRKELSDSINVTRHEAFEALGDRRISSAEFQDARDYWQQLQIYESKLQGLIMSLQLDFLLDTNVDSPRSRIVQATDKLKTAARRIQEFQNFLAAVADVIEIFAGVIKAIQGGAIANIANAVA
jgi:5'-deoxynucleotidase YfbR-like HD superfamily hydrolase